ncbi:hypothetical protein [Halopiger djelfimassiliensis]|uniref:hypothetical protein n=1 Tax=Halopiger djelfimassiliensis TaxID=1293047 RepID=UPI000677FAF8|nr:hypothetical protein [Halopiger djelfimassiliensis]
MSESTDPTDDEELTNKRKARQKSRNRSREARSSSIFDSDEGYLSAAGQLAVEAGRYGYRSTYQRNGEEYSEWNEITNWVAETKALVQPDDGQPLIRLQIHPAESVDADSFETEIPVSAFNEPREFREEILSERLWTRFTPGAANRSNGEVLADIRSTINQQDYSDYRGVEHVGYHNTEYVLPGGTLGPKGWLEDPDRAAWAPTGDSGLWTAVDIEPGDGYNPNEMPDICETLSDIRCIDELVPVLGWMHAAAIRPLVMEIAGEYPILSISGTTGTGKTSTLEALYELFGLRGEPFGATDTNFTTQKKLSSSNAVPVWLDEYKPSQIADHKVDRLHEQLRHATKGKTVTKGTANLESVKYRIGAPIILSGEQEVQESAVRRRSVLVNFTTGSTADEYRDAYNRLRDHELSQYAIAYYQWLTGQITPSKIREAWAKADDFIDEAITADIGESERNGLRTVCVGMKLYQSFAADMGVDSDELPTAEDLIAGLEHVVERIGPDGHRREHVDDYVELVTAAAQDDYLSEGEHYRVVNSRKWGTECLALHMPSAYPSVRRYIQDFNLDETVLSKRDYLDNFRDKMGENEGYVLDVNRKTNGLENGSKAVYLDIRSADDLLQGFQAAAFIDIDDSETNDGEEADTNAAEPSQTPITDILEETATATIPKPVQGTVSESGVSGIGDGTKIQLVAGFDVVDVIDWDGDHDLEQYVGKTIQIVRAQAGEYDGTKQIELIPESEIKVVEEPTEGGQTGLDDAADDGDEPTQAERIDDVRTAVSEMAPVSDGALAAALSDDYAPDKVQATLEKLAEQGDIHDPDGDGWRPT